MIFNYQMLVERYPKLYKMVDNSIQFPTMKSSLYSTEKINKVVVHLFYSQKQNKIKHSVFLLFQHYKDIEVVVYR